MILSCNHICKSFDGIDIVRDASFILEEREKAAIVGINGAGKSTLLKIITEELSADSGTVAIGKEKTLGYLAQHVEICSNTTIYDELLSVKEHILALEQQIRQLEKQMEGLEGNELEEALNQYSKLNHAFEMENGYSYKSELTGVLKGLGFHDEEFQKPINTLSGGQKTRVFLGKLLLSKPDILLLDEPTNHLDMDAIRWLESFLSLYEGNVLIVAHDRYFLDKIVSKIIEIDRCQVRTYSGNYSDYTKKRDLLRESEQKQYENQQREIKHQQAVIDKLKSFNREKSIKRAESREKMLAKIEVLEKPTEQNARMKLTLNPQVISGTDVLSIKNMSKSFDSLLFSDFNADIKRGERVAVIGGNGTGKTTLLKIICQQLDADSGELRLGTNVEIGYYDQEHQVLSPHKSIFDEISDTYPHMTGTQIRNMLAAFLFTGDDVFKLVGDLSGGERGRLCLAKLMLSKANFLILDEPTNHLDMLSKEILEHALQNYTGTVLYVSHDRYFINQTATRILELNNHTFISYMGNYDYYLEKKDTMNALYARETNAQASQNDKKEESSQKADWKAQKEQQAKLRKLQNEYKKVEEEITKQENLLSQLNCQLTNPDIYSDSEKLYEIHKQQEELQNQLSSLYERWEELSDKL